MHRNVVEKQCNLKKLLPLLTDNYKNVALETVDAILFNYTKNVSVTALINVL